jgi:lyso-ornithine lipid O-acyltransferase
VRSAATGALRAAGRVTGLAATVARTIWRAGAAARAGDDAAVRRAQALLLGDAAARTLAVHGVAVRASGPLPPHGALLVANHVSYLDPLVVAGLVPCLPISKAELASWPLLGAVARRSGVLFVARGDQGSGLRVMRAAQRALSEGVSILNFPEGTTTAGGDVLGFRRGLFAVARRVGAPVVPVALAYDPPELAWTGDATFLPHYLRLAASRGAEVRVTFGAPIRAQGRPGELAGEARDRIRALLEEEPRWASRTR